MLPCRLLFPSDATSGLRNNILGALLRRPLQRLDAWQTRRHLHAHVGGIVDQIQPEAEVELRGYAKATIPDLPVLFDG